MPNNFFQDSVDLKSLFEKIIECHQEPRRYTRSQDAFEYFIGILQELKDLSRQQVEG